MRAEYRSSLAAAAAAELGTSCMLASLLMMARIECVGLRQIEACGSSSEVAAAAAAARASRAGCDVASGLIAAAAAAVGAKVRAAAAAGVDWLSRMQRVAAAAA